MPVVRAALLVPAAAAGAAAGLLGSFVHEVRLLGLPAGLLLAAALSAAVFVTGGLVLGRRGAVVAAGGWVVVVLLLSTQRPEGDLVVAGDPAGYAWLLGGTVLAVGCCSPRYRRPSAGADGGR